MIVAEQISQLKAWRQSQDRVVFVPTMGALHEGHMELVRRARQTGLPVVVSIFVNPTQFNDPSDLTNYPRTLEQDLRGLADAGVDLVFVPTAEEIYADSKRFVVSEKQDSQVLCGPRRPGHFDGVLTVVLKLFHLVRPSVAFFGEKDYQQLHLIRGMVASLFLDIDIQGVPTVREPDGLAMSSRNRRLTLAERELAPAIYRVITQAQSPEQAVQELSRLGFDVEYVEEHWGRRFVAVRLGAVRLIDNVAL